MKILSDQCSHKSGVESVALKNKQNSSNQKKPQQIQSQKDFEIERSLYYLGRALYRHSLLKQERCE